MGERCSSSKQPTFQVLLVADVVAKCHSSIIALVQVFVLIAILLGGVVVCDTPEEEADGGCCFGWSVRGESTGSLANIIASRTRGLH